MNQMNFIDSTVHPLDGVGNGQNEKRHCRDQPSDESRKPARRESPWVCGEHKFASTSLICGMVGRSVALREVIEQVRVVATTDATVLVLGESGTGKELIAEALHANSHRRHKPLVSVNCGSIPSELFESEFFGHAKGSFTGALRDRVGRFQLADGGTLFLDEVGEIPIAHQAKLLRVLQVGQFERVGEEATRQVDVRLIAATNKDLREEVRMGRFRQDLYYRLAVFPLAVPPLRDRKEDVAILAEHFVSVFGERLNGSRGLISDEDLKLLEEYDWPGNVRELQNVIQRAMILAKGTWLRFDLPAAETMVGPDLPSKEGMREHGSLAGKVLNSESLRQLERDSIIAALKQSYWKVSGRGGAAELLGINPNTLAYRMRSLGIDRGKIAR
jgi:transcriptional regulator with GAF, ATPase, and Fis domain